MNRCLVENGHRQTVQGYAERPVRAPLAGRCVCTWVDAPTELRHPVLPDACIDIVWDGAELRVAGPDTGPVPSTSTATFVGIRFLPGSAPGFLGVGADELRDQNVALNDLWGAAASELVERLSSQPHRAQQTLEEALLRRQEHAAGMDPLVPRVIDALRRPEFSSATVQSLARQLGLGERTLRRRCAAAFGYGPKTLHRILRFRRALRLLQTGMSLADVAVAAGFADQAHLSFESQRLAGYAPGQITSSGNLVLSANGIRDGDGVHAASALERMTTMTRPDLRT